MSNNQPLLLIVQKTRPSVAERITAFKNQHNIKTHRTSGMRAEDGPWIAVLCFEGETRTLGEIMAAECRLYEEGGRIAEGAGELSAIRTLCEKNRIPCDL